MTNETVGFVILGLLIAGLAAAVVLKLLVWRANAKVRFVSTRSRGETPAVVRLDRWFASQARRVDRFFSLSRWQQKRRHRRARTRRSDRRDA